ncbi:hypothetical protein E2P79_20725 [Aeromonas schubertii]|nr:hypothetical protein E2P79_20725 [Aeromonas schubertii]
MWVILCKSCWSVGGLSERYKSVVFSLFFPCHPGAPPYNAPSPARRMAPDGQRVGNANPAAKEKR